MSVRWRSLPHQPDQGGFADVAGGRLTVRRLGRHSRDFEGRWNGRREGVWKGVGRAKRAMEAQHNSGLLQGSMVMVRFSNMRFGPNNELVETNVRELKQSDIAKCPHFILVADHYREDGSCKCNDPNEKVMEEWGYKWDGKQWSGK